MLDSLDPRVSRLTPIKRDPVAKIELDQLETYEIFLQLKENKPYQHVGIVHAPNEEFAFLFAKEQFSRRMTCTGIWAVRTQNVQSTSISEGERSIYAEIQVPSDPPNGPAAAYEIFHLIKRGKQQIHVGTVTAGNADWALWEAKSTFGQGKSVYGVWVIRTTEIFQSSENDRDIWATLPEKKYREAIDYKGQSKIDEFKQNA